MQFTFTDYLQRRDPNLYSEIADIGLDLSDPKINSAFIAQLQKEKGVDLKQVAANVKANPESKPDKAQLAANQQAKLQQDVLDGKATPAGMKSSDWQTSVGLLTPTGNAVPNQIGRGKPAVDVAGTLEKGAADGYLPANVDKLTPAWLKMNKVKPPVAATTPTIDPKKKMTPADIAKAKTNPAGTMV